MVCKKLAMSIGPSDELTIYNASAEVKSVLLNFKNPGPGSDAVVSVLYV